MRGPHANKPILAIELEDDPAHEGAEHFESLTEIVELLSFFGGGSHARRCAVDLSHVRLVSTARRAAQLRRSQAPPQNSLGRSGEGGRAATLVEGVSPGESFVAPVPSFAALS